MNQDKKKMAMLIIKKDKPSEESPKKEESSESFVDKGEDKNHGAISAMEDMMSAMSEGKAEDAITAFKYLLEMVKMEESDDDSSDSEDES